MSPLLLRILTDDHHKVPHDVQLLTLSITMVDTLYWGKIMMGSKF